VALGGGEPLLHPALELVLVRCHALGIVPNLTTSGLHLSEGNLDLLARYCGAVGLSLEGVGEDLDRCRVSGFTRFELTLDKLLARGIRVVLQVTLDVVGNPRDTHLSKIWAGLTTKRFRGHMALRAGDNPRCLDGRKYSYCLGGYPIMDLANRGRDYLGATVASRV
jgi:MoaA/NifB/PqqE/SkfB family radical SAM enzyme